MTKGGTLDVGVACGGTGGHMFPGLAVAEGLRGRGHRVLLWVAGRGVEAPAIDGWEGEVERVWASGFPRGELLRSAGSCLRLLGACMGARGRMRAAKPDVLLAMGSYASVGPVVAAWSLGVPVVLHEANVVPGRANSLLSRFAAVTAVAFEATVPHLHGRDVVVTGFPLRRDFGKRFDSGEVPGTGFTVLVIGGSQGAHFLNETASAAACRLYRGGEKLRMIHLTGPDDEPTVRQAYTEAGVPHLTFSFLKDVEKAYNAADLAIARSGAATCAELCACGLPALLVPLPSATRDHQAANARVLAEAGAADVIEQNDLSIDGLMAYSAECCRQPAKLERMRLASATLRIPDATQRLVSLVEKTGLQRRAS